MIEIIFAVMLIIGIIFQLVSVYWESWIFSILTVIWFIKLMADSLNIQELIVYQPIEVNNTIINGSYTYATNTDYGLSSILLIFVLINIVLAIYFRAGQTFKQRYKI